MSKRAKKISYEASVAELEAVVARMEQGDMPLEDALQAFEEGVRLSRECQQLLKAAEQRVTLLTADGEEDFLADD
jgi:exodeoxyribonuclease VII small subunit